MGDIPGQDRHQQVLFPESLDDSLDEANPVRFLDVFVNGLDLKALGFTHAPPNQTGRPAYQPGTLRKLYLYGYLNKSRLSRKLEHESQRNLELMGLLQTLPPDFKTMAALRKENSHALQGVCRAFTLLCKTLALFGRELIAIDGSKCKAVKSKARNFTEQKLRPFSNKSMKRLLPLAKSLMSKTRLKPLRPNPLHKYGKKTWSNAGPNKGDIRSCLRRYPRVDRAARSWPRRDPRRSTGTGNFRSRRLDGLWAERVGVDASCGLLRRSHLEGHQAGRPAGGGAHAVRAGHQPQDRQGARDHDAPLPAAPGR